MDDELERVYKEEGIDYSRYYPDICLEGLRKIPTKNSQDRWCSGQDSNRASPKSESEHYHYVSYLVSDTII
jgi:hypothetical protein